MNLQFENPKSLFLLIAVLPFFFYRIFTFKAELLRFPTIQIKGKGNPNILWVYSKFILESTLLCIFIAGIASPYSTIEKTGMEEKGIDVSFVLDISASMQAADFPPTRLESMKNITLDFIKRSSKNRISVVVFAGSVFTQSPLTSDHEILSELVNGLSFESIDHNASGGTAIGDALLTSADQLIKNKVPNRDQAIILITDGENTEGVDPLLCAKYISDSKIRLYIIGLGGKKEIPVHVNGKPYLTPTGKILTTSLLDDELKKIAKEASGKYFHAESKNVLTDIFDELNRMESTLIEVKGQIEKNSLNHFLAILGLGFFISLFILNFSIRRPIK